MLVRLVNRFTPQIERQRFLTLDIQLDSIFSVLGNGIISGWQISLTPQPNGDGSVSDPDPLTIYVKPGSGHIDSLACETLSWTTVSGLTDGTSVFPGINYIYAATTRNTPQLKEVSFFISNSFLDQPNIIPLGICTVVNGAIAVDSKDRIEIGTLSVLLAGLAAHRHGKDGISAIDLANDVKGFLSSSNIGDIPAERVTNGILDPARFEISHDHLLNGGLFNHEDIDSSIELLQKANRKLFGDISATNLLQLIVATKKAMTNCDRFFRNLIVIVPGIDNNTFDNSLTFMDPTSAWESNLFDEGTGSYTDSDSETVQFDDDASVVDYVTGEITGVLSGGLSIHGHNIDTEAEFKKGFYDDRYVEITTTSIDGNPYGYEYGYGYGYGEGLDFFNVFGVASGTVDEEGNEIHIGYGTSEFESDYLYSYNYGHGYEYVAAGSTLPGHVDVTLSRGVADTVLFDKVNGDSINFPQDYTDSQDAANEANEDDTLNDDNTRSVVYDTLLERFKYVLPTTTGETVTVAKFKDPRLVWNFDLTDTNSSYDWTSFDTFMMKLVNPSSTESVDIEISGDWYLKLICEIDGTDFESDPISILDLEDGDVHSIEAGGSKTISVDLAIIPASSSFDRSKIKKFVVYTENLTVDVVEDGTQAFTWDNYLSVLSLGGILFYSTNDANNSITQLYLIVPSTPAARLEDILFFADEPSDSRVLIYVRSADANGGGDGFSLLASASYGNPYMNKARTGETARPSGSLMTEAPGTHFEFKIVLQPSTDANYAPTLHSISIRYSTTGGSESIDFGSDEDFDINRTSEVQRININLNSDSNLIIRKNENVGNRRCGTNSRYLEFTKNSAGLYKLDSSLPDYYGKTLPKTFAQYLDSSKSTGISYVGAVKRMNNQDFVVADTGNQRVAIFDQDTQKMTWCLSGSTCYNDTKIEDELFPVFAHYNPNTFTLYVSFSHVLSSTITINKWYVVDSDSYFKLNSLSLADGGDAVSIINANGIGGVQGGGMVKIVLGTISQKSMKRLTGSLSLSVSPDSVSSTITGSNKRTEAFGGIPIDILNVYYTAFSSPVDIKIDADDQLLIAQVIDSNSAKGASAIMKINPKNPETKLLDFNAASDGIAFKFDVIYMGSVEEIVSEAGNKELLVADMKNQRVIRFDQENGTVIWQYGKDATGGRASIPANLYPSCATRGEDGYFYVALIDKTSSKYSKIVQISNDIELTKTILEGTVSNPKDVYFLQNQLVIST
jgi:hypothetical protein